ncbi:MAG: hypothetical protein IPO21_15135 [Bacteroidales bacterium]|nr:hypothetical protein [Bacteroidales bacterium]
MTASKSIAIICASKYGFTLLCSLAIFKKLADVGVYVSLNNLAEETPDLNKYDTVILGGPIHNGKFFRPLNKFIQNNVEQLLTKQLAVFITCIDEERVEDYYKSALPEAVYLNTFYKTCLGGMLQFNKLHPIEKR